MSRADSHHSTNLSSLIRDPFVRAAFEAAERERARSLLEMLAEARVDIRQGVDPKLLQREHEIAGLLNSNAQRLLTLRGAGTEEKAAALKKEISEMESESQQVELAIGDRPFDGGSPRRPRQNRPPCRYSSVIHPGRYRRRNCL